MIQHPDIPVPRSIRRSPCRSVLLSLLAALLLLIPVSAYSTDTAAVPCEVVLAIVHLNPDPLADTVLGIRTAAGYLPLRILWGRALPQEHGRLDAGAPGLPASDHPVPQTIIIYPGSLPPNGSVALQQVNSDTLVDLVLHLHSTVTGHGADRDSLRSLVIFGQRALTAMPVITIADIGRFQADPFFAMELVKGSELTEPATRDLSDRTSYILEPVNLAIDSRDSIIAPMESPTAATNHSGSAQTRGSVQISPNPARDAMMIEAAGLPAGDYIIEVVSVNGEGLVREETRIGDREHLRRTLDVRHMPSGYYVVRIVHGDSPAGGGSCIAACPIIITR